MWAVGCHQALLLLAYVYYYYNICLLFILVLVLVTWPTPHSKYVAAGICQYFYSGIGHWLCSAQLLWWLWSCSGLPCPLCWNHTETLHDQWCYNGHICVMVLSCALWIFQQMFCLTPLYIHFHSSVPTTNCWRRKKITSTGPSAAASTQHGLWIGQILLIKTKTRTIRTQTLRINLT